MSEENLVSKIKHAEAEGEALEHVHGHAEAMTLIYSMIALNATTYKFETDLFDKTTGEDLGTYIIEIKKK